MNREPESTKQTLAKKIYRLQTLFNLKKILTGEKNTVQQIRTYFFANRLAYQRHHSKEGFMHFRVSGDGKYHEEDVYYQPDMVESHIPPNGRVLELGFGQGANIFYLAKRRPDASFCGVDIAPTNPPHSLNNLRLFEQDYNDLSMFPADSFDVVYGIETLVYITRKEQVFREVLRILKPGGVFIVFDYVLLNALEQYDQLGQAAVALVSKCGAAAVIEPRARWEQQFQNAGFRKLHEADIGWNIFPDLERLERKARRIINDPKLSERIFRLMPEAFLNNLVMGYLAKDIALAGLMTYMEWVFEKS